MFTWANTLSTTKYLGEENRLENIEQVEKFTVGDSKNYFSDGIRVRHPKIIYLNVAYK